AGHRRSAVSGVPGFIDLVLTVFGVIVLLLCALASLLALRNEGLIEQHHLLAAGTANLTHWPARLSLRGFDCSPSSPWSTPGAWTRPHPMKLP
ncbi:MAG: hypothetical protein ACRDQ5_28095, partial [Sciscionella sp.]